MNEEEKAEVVINAMYFITNYPNDFIQKCWADDPGMAKWFTDKFHYYYKTYGAVAGPVNFFLYLGGGHQEKLAMWINENYSYKGKAK